MDLIFSFSHKTRDARKHGRASALPLGGGVKKNERFANKHRTAHTEQLRSNAAGPRARREVPANCLRAGSCRGSVPHLPGLSRDFDFISEWDGMSGMEVVFGSLIFLAVLIV